MRRCRAVPRARVAIALAAAALCMPSCADRRTQGPSGEGTGTAGPEADGRRRETSGWTVEPGPPLPEPIANNAVAAAMVDGRAVVFTFLGLGAGRDFRAIMTRAYVLDTRSGAWQRLPDVPGRVGRLAATAQTLGDRVYVFGGYEVAADGRETTSPAVDILDVRTARYTRGADMPTPVDDSVSGVWRGRLVFLIGGWSMTANVSVVQAYDPAGDRWAQATPMIGTPVFGHAGGVVRDTIVYCGGAIMNAPRTPKYLPTLECYRGDIDPARPTSIAWRRIRALPGPASYRVAAGPVDTTTMTGVMFVGGAANPYNYDGVGYDGRPSEPEGVGWIYDVDRDDWVPGPRLDTPTMDHRGIVRAGDDWWIVGGFEAGRHVTTRVARLRRAE